MEKETAKRCLGLALMVISALFIVILVILGFQSLIDALVELVLISVGVLATLGLKLLFFSKPSTLETSPLFHWTDVKLIKSAITNEVSDLPNFSHLCIHFSRKSDTADNPHDPYRVVNSKTKKAYWVLTELLVLNKRNIITSNTHDGPDKLFRYLQKNKIDDVDRNPNLGELAESA